jgi:hypothetical protein
MYVMIECGHKRLRLFKLMLDIRTVAVFGGLILIYRLSLSDLPQLVAKGS